MRPLLFLALLLPACRGCQWAREAEEVTYQEVRPEALLRKYTWFKDAAAQLDKKRADIEVYRTRITTMDQMYAETPRAAWPRPDLEQYNLWATEVAGVTAGYNSLAADYNARMASENWAFCNVGTLPAGATDPLPRDFAPYLEK